MTKRMARKAKRSKTTGERPTVRIGKKGATGSLMNEISKHLDKRKSVKVKILTTALIDEEANGIAQKVAKETKSKIVQLRGHTFILYKPKKN